MTAPDWREATEANDGPDPADYECGAHCACGPCMAGAR